jgi:hypothetical protein
MRLPGRWRILVVDRFIFALLLERLAADDQEYKYEWLEVPLGGDATALAG